MSIGEQTLGSARDAVKEALAQPEREIDPSTTFDEVAKGLQVSRMAIAALDALTIEQRRSINEPLLKAQLFLKAAARVFKEALAQPEQEPVAWPCVIAEADFSENIITLTMQCTDYKVSAGKHWLSTTPPQRTWVGLTDDEIDQGLLRSDYAFKTAEAWRAGVVFAMTKLKEKNT